jgi:DNA-binding transcriptional LysR family regulator
MHRFTKRYPELDIRIDSNDAPVDLDADSTDVAVRYGPVRMATRRCCFASGWWRCTAPSCWGLDRMN